MTTIESASNSTTPPRYDVNDAAYGWSLTRDDVPGTTAWAVAGEVTWTTTWSPGLRSLTATVWPLPITILVDGLTRTTVPSPSRISRPVSSTRMTRPMRSRSLHCRAAPAARYPTGAALFTNTSAPGWTVFQGTACQTR